MLASAPRGEDLRPGTFSPFHALFEGLPSEVHRVWDRRGLSLHAAEAGRQLLQPGLPKSSLSSQGQDESASGALHDPPMMGYPDAKKTNAAHLSDLADPYRRSRPLQQTKTRKCIHCKQPDPPVTTCPQKRTDPSAKPAAREGP
jgi:hypothetical protein